MEAFTSPVLSRLRWPLARCLQAVQVGKVGGEPTATTNLLGRTAFESPIFSIGTGAWILTLMMAM